MRNVSEKRKENQNTLSIFSNLFSENRDVYEITWENLVQPDRLQLGIYVCVCMCVFIYIYIYIYIKQEACASHVG